MFCNSVFAQDTTKQAWNVQFPPLDFSHPVKLNAVNDSVLVYISEGFLLRSSDAGVTWTRVNLPGCFTPQNGQFLTNQLGWIVGDLGTVYKTTDGGLTWVYKRLPTTAIEIRYVSFSSPLIGWIGGSYGQVLKTTDGGDTWFFQGYYDFFKGGSESYMYVHAVTDSIVWACRWFRVLEAGDPNPADSCDECYYLNVEVFRSTDGGTTWNDSRTWDVIPEDVLTARNQHGFLRDFSSVFACSANRASLFFRPHHGIDTWFRYTTTDGGTTWDSIAFGTNPVNRYAEVFDCGLAWGTDSAQQNLFRSTSSDTIIWKPRAFPCAGSCIPYLYDFVDTNIGFVFSDNGNNTVSIYRTTDGAATWQQRATEILNRGSLVDVKFVNPNDGWSVGNDSVHGIVMQTSDRGTHWNILNTTGAPLHNLQHVQFVDTLNGWMLGDSLYHTTDGGHAWKVDGRFPMDSLRPQVKYVWAEFVTPRVGWMVRSDWLTWHTIDSGATWQQVHSSDTTVIITIAHAINENNLLAMGTVSDSAYEFRILDTGHAYQEFALHPAGNPPTVPVSIFFLDSLHGWFADTLPNFYLTTDGGATWIFLIYNPSLKPTTSLFFTDTVNGWMTTGNLFLYDNFVSELNPYPSELLVSAGSIQQLSAGGTGVVQQNCILQGLNALEFIGDSLGWAVGENLTVYHYYLPASSKPKRNPMMVLSTPVLDFGNVAPGLVGRDSLIVRNGGTDTLYVWGTTSPDDKYKSFHVGTILPSQPIAPGDSMTLYINFDPQYAIIYSATFYIQSNDDTQYVYLHGTGTFTGVRQQNLFASKIQLIENYPNPFSDATTLILDPSLDGISSLKIFNAVGNSVAEIPVAHSREIPFAAKKLPAGNYIVEARTPLHLVRQRIVLVR